MSKCKKCENCSKSIHRTESEKDYLLKRMNIIEGQVRGVRQMLESDRYCEDILIQITAIDKSLKGLGKQIIKSHLSSCITTDLKEGNLETIDEIIALFDRINK